MANHPHWPAIDSQAFEGYGDEQTIEKGKKLKGQLVSLCQLFDSNSKQRPYLHG